MTLHLEKKKKNCTKEWHQLFTQTAEAPDKDVALLIPHLFFPLFFLYVHVDIKDMNMNVLNALSNEAQRNENSLAKTGRKIFT